MLYERIKADIVTTMLEGRHTDLKHKLMVLRSLKASIDTQVKDERGPSDAPPPDALVELCLSRELKKRQEAQLAYEKADAVDAAESERLEAEIIRAYLPKPLSVEEVRDQLIIVMASITNPSIGPVMKEMQEFCGARFPGKDLSDMVKAAVAS